MTISRGAVDTTCLCLLNRSATTIIYSFNSASDKIDLVGFSGFADFNDVAAHLSDDGAGNTVLTLASDETITLHGVNSTSLSAGNFEFNQQTVLENSADYDHRQRC